MKNILKTYQYANGEIQRVQAVCCDSWQDLDFCYPPFSKPAIEHIEAIYRDFFVAKAPYIFGTMYVFHLPDDLKLPFETRMADREAAARKFLMKNHKKQAGKDFLKQLEERGCLAIIKGKNPFARHFIPYRDIGFLSQVEGKLKVNSSFFTFDVFDADSPYDIFGTPIGLMVKDGKILNPPLFHREALLVDKGGRITVRPVELNELKLNISGKIYQRPDQRSSPDSDGYDVIVVGNKVIDVLDHGNNLIPSSGFIIQTGEKNIRPGDTVSYEGLEDIAFAIQCGNSILINDKKTTEFTVPYYNIFKPFTVQTVPANYPKDFHKDRAPRIALGSDKDGKPVILWAEGAGKMKYEAGKDSCGASLAEMAEIAEDLGLVNAVNLDGGGSAQIILDEQRYLQISDRNFQNNSESERPVPVGLVIK